MVADHLRGVHRPYAGAQFRLAIAGAATGQRLLTGCVLFRPKHVASRPVADYGRVIFLEHWCQDQSAAFDLFSKLLLGQAEFDGYKVQGTFSQSRWERHTYPIGGDEFASGWKLISSLDQVRDTNDFQTHLGQGPLLGYGLRPYLGPAQAIAEWIFGMRSDSYSGSLPHPNEIVTILPDTRARIVSGQWTPEILAIELELNVPHDSVQLQIAHVGSMSPFRITSASEGNQDIEVPDDTREIAVYLVHSSGDCITWVHLSRLYPTVGSSKAEASAEELAVRDLRSGEGDTVEYKPFLSPNDSKETEVVKTAVAFANTAGGRIYVGVRDEDGSPQGGSELRKAFSAGIEEAWKAQADRLRWLIANRVNPRPPFVIDKLLVFGEPVVVVAVEPGKEGPYSMHDNQIFVRRGATNLRPSPQELPRLSRKSSPFGGRGLG